MKTFLYVCLLNVEYYAVRNKVSENKTFYINSEDEQEFLDSIFSTSKIIYSVLINQKNHKPSQRMTGWDQPIRTEELLILSSD